MSASETKQVKGLQQEVSLLSEEIRVLKAHLKKARKDVKLLDYVQSQTKGYGKGWILRESVMSRGMRLHETDINIAKPTVRAAIRDHMSLVNKKPVPVGYHLRGILDTDSKG